MQLSVGVGLGVLVGLLLGLVVGRRFRPPDAPESVAVRSQRESREVILSALAQAARMLFGAGGNDEVMPSALAVLGEAVGADRVYVFENHRHPASGELLASMRYEWCREGIRAEIDNPDMQDMSYDRIIPDWRPVFEAREPVVGSVNEMAPAERALLEAQNILSILVVPIFLDGAFWGLIGFDDCTQKRSWGQAEIDALEVASGTIGGAIRSVRAEEELRRLVSTDSLTGLSSRRAFLAQSREVFERSRLSGRTLALMIMDLDHFKSVNDTFGHPAGDESLLAFAGICRHVLRDDDLIGRTGGEEFAVLLEDVDEYQAVRIAEKLRSSVASSRLPTAAGDIDLTVSIGIAVPADGERDLNALLKRADDALYAAKRGGRNQVELSSLSS